MNSLVSFPVAKLLKEKVFDGETFDFYEYSGDPSEVGYPQAYLSKYGSRDRSNSNYVSPERRLE